MSDTDIPEPQYAAQAGHKYPVEEHLAAQVGQTWPDSDKPLHPDAKPAAGPTDDTEGRHGGTE